MNQFSILNIRVDNLSQKEILEKVENFLCRNIFHQIATVNPEFILEAQKNVEFKNILNNCDLNVADGFGIKLAFWRYGRHLKTRMAGADLMLEILKIAQEKNLKIFLAANKDGLSNFEETKKAILKIYPNLEITGADLEKNKKQVQVSRLNLEVLEKLNANTKQELKKDFAELINSSEINGSGETPEPADIIFCNFGAPYQEKFLHSLKNAKDSKIKLAMGVGGSFDFLTGKIKRAPVFIRKIGLEWLWRFILEPKYRLKRIWNATAVFTIKIIFNI